MVIRGQINANKLISIYDICNKIFNDDDCFYTTEEIEQKKTNKENIFIRKE